MSCRSGVEVGRQVGGCFECSLTIRMCTYGLFCFDKFGGSVHRCRALGYRRRSNTLFSRLYDCLDFSGLSLRDLD